MASTRRLAAYLVGVNRTYLSKLEKGAGDQTPVIIARWPVWGSRYLPAPLAIRNSLLGRQRLYLRSVSPVSRPANRNGYRIAIGATKR